MLEFLGLIALIAIIFGISMGEALGGLVSGIIWTVAICAVLGFIGGLYSDIKNGVFRETEEHKKKRLAQIEAQKKAQEAYKEAHKNDWILAVILLAMMAVPIFLLWLFNH